jgi:uncharacterized membrane protein (UPF0127 family)
MIKQIILPIIGVAAFVIAVGLFIQKSGSINITNLPAVPSSSAIKTITVGGKTLNVEIANTAALRTEGLGDRSLLAADNGMLFVFDEKNVEPGFWMKGMFFPLDIIWINDGVVAKIDKNIPAPAAGTPDSELKVYYPTTPIDYVLEVNAGFSDSNGLKVGSQVILPAL